MIPVGALVTLPGLEPATLVVERYSAPTGIDYRGRPEGQGTADADELEVVMVTHQASRKQVERAGLDAALDWRAFYANAGLRTATDDGARPDVIRYGGERWEVATVGDYVSLGGISIALARRIE